MSGMITSKAVGKEIYKGLTAAHIAQHMLKRYTQPEWALFFEVGDCTGVANRYADAIAVNMFESRGLEIIGFEFKVSSSDWLRELKNPAKAEPIYRFCDKWYVVTPKNLVQDGELPDTWGLIEIDEKGMRQKVKAPKREAAPIDKRFFAALCRRSYEMGKYVIEPFLKERLEAQKLSFDQRLERELNQRRGHYEILKEKVDQFEKLSGIKIGQWDSATREAELIRLISSHSADLENFAKVYMNTAITVQKHKENTAELIKDLRAFLYPDAAINE